MGLRKAKTVERRGEWAIEEETLSDGSTVYNVVGRGLHFACRGHGHAYNLAGLLANCLGVDQDAVSALVPFGHPDLCKVLGGNVEGVESPVFQRGEAVLRIRDFRAARDLVWSTSAPFFF